MDFLLNLSKWTKRPEQLARAQEAYDNLEPCDFPSDWGDLVEEEYDDEDLLP